MPRLAFALFRWFPHGGLQQDLLKVLRACTGRATCVVFCQQWDGAHPPGVEVVVIPGKGWTATARRADFARRLQQQVAGQFDAVVGFNRLPGLDWYFAADTCFAEHAAKKGWWYRLTPRARQYLEFERKVFTPAASTHVLLLSPQQRRQYQQHYGTPDERLHQVPPGIGRQHRAAADAAALRAEIRAEWDIAEQQLLILQVGSGFNTKGVSRALRALAAQPEPLRRHIRYVLIGRDAPGPWLRRAAALGLREQVRILPPRDDLPRCLQGADLLLHPSVRDSAGMVLLEALVAGLPVLTTASCGYAFHVEQAQAGIVCPDPFQQRFLNQALYHMLQNNRDPWRENGIMYGQIHNLYDMPDTVAALLLAREGSV